jgi:hypothetical protein
MFEIEKHSFGDLEENERDMALTFLKGTSWEEIFKDYLEEESGPPAWLLELSRAWSSDSLFTISQLDPVWSSCSLVHDHSNGDHWLSEEGADGFGYFEKIFPSGTTLSPDDVCKAVFRFLERTGDCVLYGNFSIHSPKWLPGAQMKSFMVRKMERHGFYTAGGEEKLSLEAWLTREYGAAR